MTVIDNSKTDVADVFKGAYVEWDSGEGGEWKWLEGLVLMFKFASIKTFSFI